MKKLFIMSCISVSLLFYSCSNFSEFEVSVEEMVQFGSIAEMENYVNTLEWEDNMPIITKRANGCSSCYSCIAEDIYGGLEGCTIGGWLGPMGCAIAGAITASYRSIREYDNLDCIREGFYPLRAMDDIIPIVSGSDHVGIAHNRILYRCIIDNISHLDVDKFMTVSIQELSNIDAFDMKKVNNEFYFVLKLGLQKIAEHKRLRQDIRTVNFISTFSVKNINASNQTRIDYIANIENDDDDDEDKISLMNAIAYYTSGFWHDKNSRNDFKIE